MTLVSMFSLGLAMVLIGLGLLVIYARQWRDRLPPSPRLGLFQHYLPVASAAQRSHRLGQFHGPDPKESRCPCKFRNTANRLGGDQDWRAARCEYNLGGGN